ncbi:DUF2239 family protein [Chitiniphilus purpureus]|uniref:DUF2239 family protein n=1 Tax=Chitiniphilus purpureus TaxID=2981137 RepID=A0ABY6DKI3_9NEIS|nr:DUF2239 family protein [Chitiniphilus sp. CD1]UXY13626.1 DUF2239 family protein [Chitiniphilus sp. CD1]
MTEQLVRSCTAFAGSRLLLSGPLVEVALAVKAATERADTPCCLVFDDETGRTIDLDLRGTKAELISRLSRLPPTMAGADAPQQSAAGQASPPARLPEARGRGRPRLGVIAREVTLLPRHWEWLAAQPGGISATLRRLVETARKNDGGKEARRTAQEAAYRFMSAIGGDLPGFEEALRALFADDRARFEQQLADWPADLRTHAIKLAFGAGSDGNKS